MVSIFIIDSNWCPLSQYYSWQPCPNWVTLFSFVVTIDNSCSPIFSIVGEHAFTSHTVKTSISKIFVNLDAIEDHNWQCPCRKKSQWYEPQDEVSMVWNCLVQSTYMQSEWLLTFFTARDAYMKPCFGKISDNAKELYWDIFDRKNSQAVQKSEYLKTTSSQSRTCKHSWPRNWWPLEAPHCCALH